MTTFMTDGRAAMPASLMAMTKGDAEASADEEPVRSRLSLYGTRRPMRTKDTI